MAAAVTLGQANIVQTRREQVFDRVHRILAADESSVIVVVTGDDPGGDLEAVIEQLHLHTINEEHRSRLVLFAWNVSITRHASLFELAQSIGLGNPVMPMCHSNGIAAAAVERVQTFAWHWREYMVIGSTDIHRVYPDERSLIDAVRREASAAEGGSVYTLLCTRGDDFSIFPRYFNTFGALNFNVKLLVDADCDGDPQQSNGSPPPISLSNNLARTQHVRSRKISLDDDDDDDDPQNPTPPITPLTAPPQQEDINKRLLALIQRAKMPFARMQKRLEPAAQVSLRKRREGLGKRAHQYVLQCFTGSYRCRKSAAKAGRVTIPLQYLPTPSSFRAALDRTIATMPKSVVYLSGLSLSSLRRLAYAALYFFSFVRQEKYFQLGDDATVRRIINKLYIAKEEDLISIVSSFFHWYGKLPTLRLQSHKLLSAGYLDRTTQKEYSTVHTMARGLLSVLMLFAICPHSSKKHPAPKNLRIWNAMLIAKKELRVVSCGPLPMLKIPVGLRDWSLLMDASKGADTPAIAQAWNLVTLLAATGLRPGSVNGNDAFVSQESQSKGDGGADVVSMERPTDDTDLDDLTSDDERFFLDFSGLRGRHLKVYRLRRHADDPPGTTRLFCELQITHEKTSGIRAFTPRLIGLHHPRLRHDNTLNWSPSGCLAIALAAISSGLVKGEDLYSVEKEPIDDKPLLVSCLDKPDIPIFHAQSMGHSGELIYGEVLKHSFISIRRAMSSVGVPEMLVSAKSLRAGFANDIVSEIYLQSKDTEMVSKQRLREALHTTNMWQSNQSDCYLRSSYHTVSKHGQSMSNCTKGDWIQALYKNSIGARPDYEFVSEVDFDKQRGSQADNETTRNTQNERRQAWRLYNAHAFLNSTVHEKTTTEIRRLLAYSEMIVDVPSTVAAYARLFRLDKPAFADALRSHYRYRSGPYKCPACKYITHLATEANEHWIQVHGHDHRKPTTRYFCPCMLTRQRGMG